MSDPVESNRTNSYFPHIDGVRALAILAVVFFHLQIPGFTGGFVGVDIFFVISGFLISRNIAEQIDANSFSFKSFYINRTRRLFPALVVTVMATLVAGYFLFTPAHFAGLGLSSVAATLSASNFLFWAESGYFDTSKAFKPLLHTWSLSVEEQFYLLWPLLLFFVRFSKKTVIAILVILIFICTAASQAFVRTIPETVFYWMPFRIGEFALGALLYFYSPERSGNLPRKIFAVAGLILCVAPVIFYSKDTVFPGISAMIPCIGAALLIRYGHSGFTGKLLSNALSIHIGRISYSLYLVHWPIVVYVSYWKLGGIGVKSLIVVIPLIYISTLLLHVFVEKRFRYPRFKKNTDVYAGFGFFAGSSAVVAVVLGFTIWVYDGWFWRYSGQTLAVVKSVDALQSQNDDKQKFFDLSNEAFDADNRESAIYLIGDSFGQDVYVALKQASPGLNIKGLLIKAACQPVIVSKALDNPNCVERRAAIFEGSELTHATTIILASSWRESAFPYIGKTLEFLKSRYSATIVIFGPRATFQDVPTLIIRHGKVEDLDKFVNKYKSHGLDDRIALIRAKTELHDANFLDVYEIMCDSNVCPITLPNAGKIMYSDNAHWTMEGAKYFGDKLMSNTSYSRLIH